MTTCTAKHALRRLFSSCAAGCMHGPLHSASQTGFDEVP
jgi:hypothetical protein